MKKMVAKHSIGTRMRNALTLSCLLGLSACGGGGGGATEVSPPPVSSTGSSSSSAGSGVVVSMNEVGKVFEQGIYHLWGLGVVINSIPRSYISRCGLSVANQIECGKTHGVTTQTGNVERPFDVVGAAYSPLYYVNDGSAVSSLPPLSFAFPAAASSADLTLRFNGAAERHWTMTLKSSDISGLPVASQLKKTDGSLVTATLAEPSTTFPEGAVAYTSIFTAKEPMLLQGVRFVFAYSESTLMSSGWCASGQRGVARPGVSLNSDNTVSVFRVTDTCSFDGLTPIATGTWSKRVSGSNAYYKVTYPDSLKAGEFSRYFASSAPLGGRLDDYVVSEQNGTLFFTALEILPGDSVENLQPYFNAAALPALRSAAGI